MIYRVSVTLKTCSCSDMKHFFERHQSAKCRCPEMEHFFERHKFTGYHVRYLTGEIKTVFPEEIAEGENQALIMGEHDILTLIYNGEDHKVVEELIKLLGTIKNDPSDNPVISCNINCQ